jgi:RNA polymerase sigma-70 factor (ECF subfamily)
MQEATALRRCMDQLEPDGRAALQRAYFDGLSYAEVAVWANRPLGTMKSLIRRSLASLKRCLEP